jgi:chromosome segregation ATPase
VEWSLRQASEPIDLKHIQPAAREAVRASVSQAASEVERLTQQRSDAVKLLQESAAEISRLIGELSAAREENRSLRKALDAQEPGDTPAANSSSAESSHRSGQLEQMLARKEEDIARLNTDWAAAREEIAALKEVLAQNNIDGDRVNELPRAMARDLDAALTALAERDEEVQQLNATLAEAQSELEHAVATATPAIGPYESALAERDQRIADLLQHGQTAMQDAEQLRKTLHEREAEFQAAYYESAALRNAAEERDRIATDYADISQTLVDSRTRLKEQETKREAVELELRMVQERLAEKESELQRLRYDLAERQQFSDSEGNIQPGAAALTEIARDELNQEIEGLKAQSAAATQRAWSLHRALEKATRLAKEREVELERLTIEFVDVRARDDARTVELQELALRLEEAVRTQDEIARECDAAKDAAQTANATSEQLKMSFDEALSLVSQRDEQLAVLQVESGQWQSRLDERAGEIQQLTFERDLATQQLKDAESDAQSEARKLRGILDKLAKTQAEREETRTYLIQREQRLEAAAAELSRWHTRDTEREAEIQRLNARLDEASRQVEAAAFESEAERAKWQPLVASHEEMKAALDDIRTQLAARDDRINELHVEAANRNGALASMKDALAQAQAANEKTTAELNDVRAQLEAREESMGSLQANTAARDNELTALNESLAALQTSLQEKDDKIDDLDFQVAGLSATLRDKDASLAQVAHELESAKQTLAASRLAESEAQAALAAVHDELQHSREAAAAAQGRLGPADAELGQLRDTVARLNAREKDLRSALDHRTSEVESLLADVNEFKTRERQVTREAEMADLRVQMSAKEEETEQLYRERSALQENLEKASAAAGQLQHELDARAAGFARQEAENATLRAEAARTAEDREALNRALEEARSGTTAIESELAAARAQADRLNQTIESFRNESAEAGRTGADMLAEIQALRNEVQRLQREADEYKSEREQESRQLTQQLELAVSEVSRSAQEIQRLSEALEAAHASSSGAGTLEEAFRLQHTLAATHEELWKHAPTADGNGEPVTPEVVNPDDEDEQKMLVDALLRFLGRR